jgi:hypothetical protein
VALLDRAAGTAGVPGIGPITVEVAGTAELAQPETGAAPKLTVLLHRVTVSEHNRMLQPTVTPDGERLRRPIPVDLHYLVTAWASTPGTQQRLLGWAIRVLEDTPTLPPALLNVAIPGTFRADETVELVWEPLTSSAEAETWQVAQTARTPSAAYVARMVPIESELGRPAAEPVQTVELAYATSVPEPGAPG